MARTKIGSLLLAGLIGWCGTLHGEAVKTITVKVFDGKTGHPVMPTGFQVRVDHQTMLHPDWVKPSDDGTAQLTLPDDASVVALQLAYDSSMELYVNCAADKYAIGDVWYPVSQIMTKGYVAPNSCGKAKINEKYKTTAVPGELILFVREKNWRERAQP
jgi:hypothetical protein